MLLFHIFLITFGTSLAIPSDVGDEELEILGPLSYFEKSVYRARVVDRTIEIIDGPIVLRNCYMYNFSIIAIADGNKYFTTMDSSAGTDCDTPKYCSVCFSAFVGENVDPKEVLYDTISLEAHIDSYGVTSTNIIIVYSSEYDPYKLIYNINGTEYVILNYFYFKLFLLIIIATGILLLVLEIREVILKYKTKQYGPVEEIDNYV